jgi:hypothetical protein
MGTKEFKPQCHLSRAQMSICRPKELHCQRKESGGAPARVPDEQLLFLSHLLHQLACSDPPPLPAQTVEQKNYLTEVRASVVQVLLLANHLMGH